MPQFDVHRNPGRSREATPYLLVIQRDRYDRMPRRVVVPLVRREYTGHTDRDLNPGFTVEGLDVVMDPLALASVPVRDLGSAIASLDHDSTRIIRAIDELVAYGR
ncbi:CcdB family protein [Skermanella rosea]|uniref:CcdB family protein n=1 Tax=Skermanella rosea TaxID=1817965 RepID=UPI0019322B24|nr:CcdB family protein [Skermanella rosea]UEM04488.1 CcdB family protein [Skermanella rosea]